MRYKAGILRGEDEASLVSQLVPGIPRNGIDFEEFVKVLHAEINRNLPDSPELIMSAFQFFTVDNSEDIIDRGTLLDALQKFGDEKWSEGEAISALHSVGLTGTQVNYKILVENVTMLWTCTNLCTFLQIDEY